MAANWRLLTQSIVNIVRSQVYHTERPFYFFAARAPSPGSVSDSWSLLSPPCVSDADIIFLSCFFLSCSFLLFSSPNFSGRRLNVYHTSTHGVALVRIQNAGLKCAARGSQEMKDHPKNRQKFTIWAPSHKFVRLYLHN